MSVKNKFKTIATQCNAIVYTINYYKKAGEFYYTVSYKIKNHPDSGYTFQGSYEACSLVYKALMYEKFKIHIETNKILIR